MYFVRYHDLKEKLRARQLSDKEAIPYLVASSVLLAVSMGIPYTMEQDTSPTVWDAASTLLSCVTAMAGVIYAYRMNGGANGHDIVVKYLVIGWIASIRCILVFVPIYLIFVICVATAFGEEILEHSVLELLAILTFEIVIYQRIGKHIRDTR